MVASPVKALIVPERGAPIECQFNPAELSLSRSNDWSPTTSKGRPTPTLRFQEGGSGSLSMKLTLDTTHSGEPVTIHTSRLLELMEVDEQLPGTDRVANKARPPWLRFRWGSFHSFKAVLAQLQLTFTYFSSTGVPLRAQAQVELTQYEHDATWPKQNPTSGTPFPHRIHHVVPGETLDRIAATYYDDPARWRLLADTNGVIDPLALTAGTPLLVPELTGADRG
jgi:hypothetical protein